MEDFQIQYKTMTVLNGLKYISQDQVEQVQHLVCSQFKIDKTEHNFNVILDAIKIYFNHKIIQSW
jgi:uncharacterized protein YlzI (FlbEa/FlbD family)